MAPWEILEYVGEALVFIGVVGEVFAGWTEPERKKLEKVSSIVLVIGLALSLAALIGTNEHFNGTIADLNAQAAGSNQTAGEAELDAASARKETAQLQKDTQGLKTEADVAKLETARLNAQIAPRRLTAAQQKRISGSLKLFADKIVGVATYHEDAEAMILGLQIEETLRKSGITVWDRLGTFTATGMPIYMGVVIDSNSPDKDLASELLKALSTKGKLVTTSASVSFGQGSTMYVPPSPKGIEGTTFVENAMIFIGEKPIPEETWQSNPENKRKPSNKP